MIDKNDFKFRDDIYDPASPDTVPIEITVGPYSGVVYRYLRVSIHEQEDTEATVRFQYELLEMGNHTETSLRSDPRFVKHLGILLNHLILESIEGKDNESGEGIIKEPNDQSGVLL